jgi:putative FmdB family regulatory protein
MPLYEYQCENCGKVFELLRRMSESDRGIECPACHSKNVDRQFSTFSAGGCGSGGARGGFT